jgi:hypothetical protein
MSGSAPGAPGGWRHWPPRIVVGLACAAQVGLLVFVIVHNYSTPGVALGSDVAPLWLGGSVWRSLGPTHSYDVGAQAALYAQFAGGRGGGFTNTYLWAPGSMLLGIPLSLLSLDAAFRAWIPLQLVALGMAALIAATAAAPSASVRLRIAAAAGAVASAGVVAIALYGQWDGIPALGIAVAYALWTRGHEGRAAMVLTVLLLSGKPHLALGLLAFVAGRGSRRGIAGMAAGVLLTALVDIALVQVAGMRGWVDALGQISALSATASLSVFGLFANTMGTGSVVEGMAIVAAIALLVCGGAFGWMSARGAPLHVCLVGATCVSLLVSPHMFTQDLAMLLPCAAAALSLALARARHAEAVIALGAVSVLSLAAEYQIFPLGSLRADPFVPLLLLALTAWAWWIAAVRSPSPIAAERGVLRRA